MKVVPDKTGRFAMRPHYEPLELDARSESIIHGFLFQLHGEVRFPISTDDLTKLIERDADDLDLYADLKKYGEEVEGVTIFLPGRRPRVQIATALSENAVYLNRYRTTLTHEYSHVNLHSPLWNQARTMSMFPEYDATNQATCKRDTMQGIGVSDWMEWQAGYMCGALLMPQSAVLEIVRSFINVNSVTLPIPAGSFHSQCLQTLLVENFSVSQEAAKVRLSQLRYLALQATSPNLLG